MRLVDGSESTWIGNVILSMICFLITIYLIKKYKLIKQNNFNINDRRHTFTLFIFSLAIALAVGAVYHKVYGWQHVTLSSNDTSLAAKILCSVNYLGVCILAFWLSLIVQPIWLLLPNYNQLNQRKSWTIWIVTCFVIDVAVYVLQLYYDNLIGTAVLTFILIILLIISSILNSLKLRNRYLSRFVYVYIMVLVVRIIIDCVWKIYRQQCAFEYVDCPFNEYFSFWTVLHLLFFMETTFIWYGIVCEQRAIEMYQKLPQDEIENNDNIIV